MPIRKISDFKLAEFLIRNFCKNCGCQFVDIQVKFLNENEDTTTEKCMFLPYHDRLSKTLFNIISSYIQNVDTIIGERVEITNEEKVAFLNFTTSILRGLSYQSNGKDKFTFPAKLSLTHCGDALVWLIMRDIVCPSFDTPFRNVKIIANKSPIHDVAIYVKDEDIIFINTDIENHPCKMAYLLRAAIESHKLDFNSVMVDLLSKSEFKNKLQGLVKANFVEDDMINDFLMICSILCNYENIEDVLVNKKTARWNGKSGLWSQSQAGTTWWYLGLIEKMLEPSRGPDWTAYFHTKPFTQDLWERVEAEKKIRGLKELPLSVLLEVQAKEFKQDPNLIIENMLADNRVW